MLTQNNVTMILTKEVSYNEQKKLLIGIAALCFVFAGGFAIGNFSRPKPRIENIRPGFADSRGRHIKNRRNPEINPEKQIATDEKRLEIEKELAKSEPDWTKIENINKEIALERAAAKTEYLKQMKQQQNIPNQ